MLPRDGWVADGERNWVLADDAGRSVLLYSLSGPAIGLQRGLPQGRYAGLWFDPRTGATSAANLPAAWNASAAVQKPDERAWLLLLRAQ